MSISLGGSGYCRASSISLPTGPTPAAPWTMCCWIKPTTGIGTYAGLFGVSTSNSSRSGAWEIIKNVGALYFQTDGSGGATVKASYTDDVWLFVAYTHTYPQSGNFSIAYYSLEGGSMTQVVLNDSGGGDTAAYMTLGVMADGSEYYKGLIAYPRLFTAALSSADLEAERDSATPVHADIAYAWTDNGSSAISTQTGGVTLATSGTVNFSSDFPDTGGASAVVSKLSLLGVG